MEELNEKECPYCKKMLPAKESKLDQSGNTHLPAKEYNCARCEYITWVAVLSKDGKSWIPNE